MREIDRRRSSFGEDSGGDSVRRNRFHGWNMSAHTRANSGTFLCADDRSTVKNCASCLLRGWGKFSSCGAMSSSCMRSRDWRQRANAYAKRNHVISWRKSWQILLKQLNICHSPQLHDASWFTYKSISEWYLLRLLHRNLWRSRSDDLTKFHYHTVRFLGRSQKKMSGIFGRITLVIAVAYNTKNFSRFILPRCKNLDLR